MIADQVNTNKEQQKDNRKNIHSDINEQVTEEADLLKCNETWVFPA